MLDAYKELTPVIYGKNGIKFLELRTEGPGGICFLMHWHERMELLRVVSGEMLLHVGGEQVCVCAGQVAVISSCMMHYGTAGKSGVMYYTIMFDVEKFHNATMASEHYLLPVSRHRMGFLPVTDHPEVVAAVDRLVETLLQKESCALMAVGIVYEIMGALCQHCLGKEKVQQRVDKGFSQVLEYIENHYRERISAKDISSHFGYNEAYFCRRFKTVTGFTVMRYLQILRLEYAQQLLKHTEDEVGVIAWKCGFADTGYFSNCFRKSMGCTPSQFRRWTSGSDFDL